MNKKNLVLIGTIVPLLLVYFGLKYFNQSRLNRNFPEYITKFDSASINKIEIEGHNQLITLAKEGEQWFVTQNNETDEADIATIERILKSLNNLKPLKLVSLDPSRFDKYGLSDSASTKVNFYDKENKIHDLTIGRFEFDQTNRNPESYVKNFKENKVFLVEGFLLMNVPINFASYRSRRPFAIAADNIKSVKATIADTIAELTRNDKGFAYNGIPTDSLKSATYLSELTNIEFYSVDGSFDPKLNPILGTVQINELKPLVLTIYNDTVGKAMVVECSAKPKKYFRTDSIYVFSRIIPKKYLN